MAKYQGNLVSKGKKYAIIVSRFNDFITTKLVDGCIDALLRHGVKENEVDVIWAPGSFEIPSVASAVVKKKAYNAIICLGAVIRGETPHFDFVASESAKGIASLSLSADVPVVNGIITTDNIEQAIERAGTKSGNKGVDAAMTAIEMVNLYADLK
ncbi:6,7-dimethyl-8-ribityllumazine synthase [Chlamydiota bacterium]